MRRKRSALEKVSGAVVKAVAGVPPDVAHLRLSALAAVEPPGLRRRALLAARIVVMRRALEEPEPVVEVVAAAPPPEPEPVVEPLPEVKAPKPLSKGVLMSINLDDVARMLSAPAEEAPPPVPVPEPEVAAPLASSPPLPDPAALFAALDWEGSAARLDPGEVPGMAGGDTAESWDQWPSGEEAVTLEPAPGATDADAADTETVPTAKAKTGGKRAKRPLAVVDASAAFAALEAAEPAAPPAKAKPLAIDLSAQFAAMDDPGDGA